MQRKINFLFLILIFFPYRVNSQIGTPGILNIDKSVYKAAGKNSDIKIGDNGYVYAGNTLGLLEYKGSYWQLYPLPLGQPIYSLLIGDNGYIYVGAFEEFGYFNRDIYGSLQYHSLSQSVNLSNENIIDIFSFENKVYFSSTNSVFMYDGEKIVNMDEFENLPFIRAINEGVFVHSESGEIGFFKDNIYDKIFSIEKQNFENIVTVLPYNNDILIFTANNGIFIYNGVSCKQWEKRINERIINRTINKAILSSDSLYIVGTNDNGIYTFNKKGEIVWEVSTSDGLQNNTIHGLCTDQNNNVWVALDNGISYIKNNSDIRFIKPYKRDLGTIFSSLIYDDYIYLATNQGLFYSKLNEYEYEFQLIPGLSDQANNLKIFDNQIICCHSKGTYLIQKESATLLSDMEDASHIQKVMIHQQEVLLQTSLKSLNIYKKNLSGKWFFSHYIDNFLYPVRQIELDAHGNIWISHYYKGLFKVKLNQNLTETERIDHYSLPGADANNYNINLFKIKGRVIFGSNYNYYTFDDISNIIIPFSSLTNNKDENIGNIQKVISIDDNNYWCITENGLYRIDYSNNELKEKRYIPFSFFDRDLPDSNYNLILSGEKVIFCLNNKIAIIPNKIEKEYETIITNIHFTSIEVFSKKDTLQLPIKLDKRESIKYITNNIIFKTGTDNSASQAIRYSYKLEGEDDKFSSPSLIPFKEYNRLGAGKYTFNAIACDYFGNELSRSSYDFEIKPPYFVSPLAILLYICFLFSISWIIYNMISKKVKESNIKIAKEQERLRQEENELKEREIIKLKNNNLQSELYFKSKEMANSSFMLINKNNILVEVKNELTAQKEDLGTRYPDKYYSKLINIINEGINLDDNWTVFQANFDRIHENFFRNLKDNYPELTSNDLKICALLRLNLSTKDIANFLGNTIRGVDSARYRLRKKLNIDSQIDIVEFLIQFKGHE